MNCNENSDRHPGPGKGETRSQEGEKRKREGGQSGSEEMSRERGSNLSLAAGLRRGYDEVGCMAQIYEFACDVETRGMHSFQEKYNSDREAQLMIWDFVLINNFFSFFEAVQSKSSLFVNLFTAVRDIVDACWLRKFLTTFTRSPSQPPALFAFPSWRELYLVMYDPAIHGETGLYKEVMELRRARLGEKAVAEEESDEKEGAKRGGAGLFGRFNAACANWKLLGPHRTEAGKLSCGTACIPQGGKVGISLCALLDIMSKGLNEGMTRLSALRDWLTDAEYEKCAALMKCRGIRGDGFVTILGVYAMCKNESDVHDISHLLAELGSERLTFGTVDCVMQNSPNGQWSTQQSYSPVPHRADNDVWKMLNTRQAMFPDDAETVHNIRIVLNKVQDYMATGMKGNRWLRYSFPDKNKGFINH